MRRSHSDVLIVTMWYPPEPAPFGQMMFELAEYLASAGLRVDVVTSVPSHPAGVVYDGWKNRAYQEIWTNSRLRVIRLGVLPRGRRKQNIPPSWARRAIGFGLFTIGALLVSLLRCKPARIFSVLQPLPIGAAMLVLGWLKGSSVIFNVQDLHPSALEKLGLIRNRFLLAFLTRLERTSYVKADRLAVICDHFKRHCVAVGARADRIAVIPNWVDLVEMRPLGRASILRKELGIPEDDIVVLYAGTIGLVSGAEVLVDAAYILRHVKSLHFVFVGSGQLMPKLRKRVEDMHLDAVQFVPFQPRERLNEVQALGDLGVVTLLPGHGASSVPSKVLGYLSASTPVVAAVDESSETARLVRQARAGVVVEPNAAESLANAIRTLVDDPAGRRALGMSGRHYLEQHHAQEAVLKKYHELITSI